MGDRANIYLRDSDDTSGIYLYTHDGAQTWPHRLQEALHFGRSRWNDPPYLARIITSRVFADLVFETIGGGLSTQLGDNQYPLLCVDLLGQRVGLYDYDDDLELEPEDLTQHDVSTWTNVMSFSAFCELDLDNWFSVPGWAPLGTVPFGVN
jgi:hypothetical protein